MGTRTYSRRGANGIRKPTALGLRTGRFVAESNDTLQGVVGGAPYDGTGLPGYPDADNDIKRLQSLNKETDRRTLDFGGFPAKTRGQRWAEESEVEDSDWYLVPNALLINGNMRRIYDDLNFQLRSALDSMTFSGAEMGISDKDLKYLEMTLYREMEDVDEDSNGGWQMLAEEGAPPPQGSSFGAADVYTSVALRKTYDNIQRLSTALNDPLVQNNPRFQGYLGEMLAQAKRVFNNLRNAEIQHIVSNIFPVLESRAEEQGFPQYFEANLSNVPPAFPENEMANQIESGRRR